MWAEFVWLMNTIPSVQICDYPAGIGLDHKKEKKEKRVEKYTCATRRLVERVEDSEEATWKVEEYAYLEKWKRKKKELRYIHGLQSGSWRGLREIGWATWKVEEYACLEKWKEKEKRAKKEVKGIHGLQGDLWRGLRVMVETI